MHKHYENKINKVEEKCVELKKEVNRISDITRGLLVLASTNLHIDMELFFNICEFCPEELESLLISNKISEDVLNSCDNNNCVCFDYLSRKKPEFFNVLLNCELLSKTTFDLFNFDKIVNCPDILKSMLESKFITRTKFNTINLNYVYDKDSLTLLLGSNLITREKYNTIDLNNIFERGTKHLSFIKTLVEFETKIDGKVVSLMTREKANTIRFNTLVGDDMYEFVLGLTFGCGLRKEPLITQQVFNSIDGRNKSLLTLRLLLESQYMNQKLFKDIWLDILVSGDNKYLENIIVAILTIKNVKGTWKLDEINFIVIINYIFRRNRGDKINYHHIISVLNNKDLDIKSYELLVRKTINHESVMGYSIFTPILNNKNLTRNFFNTDLIDFMKKYGRSKLYKRNIYNEYTRNWANYIINNKDLETIMKHRFLNYEVYNMFIQTCVEKNKFELILNNKFISGDILNNYYYVKDNSIIRDGNGDKYKKEKLINLIDKKQLESPLFLYRLDEKSLDYVYDTISNGGMINRLIYGNKYHSESDKARKALGIICRFIYNCYFGPNGKFYKKIDYKIKTLKIKDF